MTAITTTGSSLEDAASALQRLALQTRNISTHTGLRIWEGLSGALPYVRSGELGTARERLTSLSANWIAEEALGIVNRFGADTQTAIVA